MARQPILVALGGNALASGSDMTDFPDLPDACKALATVVDQGLVITHGNGPQIGRLAQQVQASDAPRPLDMLGAETEGLLGYCIEQELSNQLDGRHNVASLLTRVEVARDDAAFDHPSKPIGPWLQEARARQLGEEAGWHFTEEGGCFRRLVPSPRPVSVLQVPVIRTLLEAGITVICAGGGGIPVLRDEHSRLSGVEAVIDKDLASALLAEQLQASLLVLATQADGVYRDWDGARQDRIGTIGVRQAQQLSLPAGSMGPKVQAAAQFAAATGQPAVIGALADLPALLQQKAGTLICPAETA